MESLNSKDIIFFDGVCNLCDRFVNFVYLRDQNRKFYYAPLQGPTAKELLGDQVDLKSIIYFKQGAVLRGVEGIGEILKILYPRWVWLLKLLPSPLGGFFYSFIAKRRYRVFGKKDRFYTPSEEQKRFFLP